MEITPQIVRQRANAARMTVNKFIQEAGVSRSTFCRWQRGKGINSLTQAKLADALAELEEGKGL